MNQTVFQQIQAPPQMLTLKNLVQVICDHLVISIDDLVNTWGKSEVVKKCGIFFMTFANKGGGDASTIRIFFSFFLKSSQENLS